MLNQYIQYKPVQYELQPHRSHSHMHLHNPWVVKKSINKVG